MNNIKLLFIILDIGLDKKVNYFLNRLGIKVKFISYATGTASPTILDFFGLTETKKNIYMAVISDAISGKVLNKLKQTFKLNKEGTGIAFSIPISSSNKFLSDIFNKKTSEWSKNMKKENEVKYQLVVTMVLAGYAERVLEANKKSGCLGGTLIKGRELTNIIPSKILGFNIEPEREIILNVVKEEKCKQIMETITEVVGIKTDAKGICLALPIADVIGLDARD